MAALLTDSSVGSDVALVVAAKKARGSALRRGLGIANRSNPMDFASSLSRARRRRRSSRTAAEGSLALTLCFGSGSGSGSVITFAVAFGALGAGMGSRVGNGDGIGGRKVSTAPILPLTISSLGISLIKKRKTESVSL